jgi:hypothetical protein
MTLTNPVNKQNIVNRYVEFVQGRANQSIVWGTNNRPPYFDNSTFGGTTAGKQISISGSNLTTTEINASNIYNVLRTETANFSNIRNLRAIVNVTGEGGDAPIGPETPENPGIIFDQTQKAHLSAAYLQGIQAPPNSGVDAGKLITRDPISVSRPLEPRTNVSGLDGFILNLRSVYDSYRNNTVTLTVNVCHSSCHSSCHGSRGRR